MPSDQAAPDLRFGVLGPLLIHRGDRPMRIGGRKSERVLAALLLGYGRTVTMSRLIRSVWDVDAPTTAEHQIRKTVAVLRHELDDDPVVHIVTDGAGYRIELPADRLDLGRFDTATEAARRTTDPAAAAGRLTEALQVWRGPALVGLDTAPLDDAGRLLNDRRLNAAEQLAELELRLGRPDRATEVLRTFADENRTRESLIRLLMIALYRAGRSADALRAFDTCRRALSDELGVDPDPELARIHERILRADPSLAGPAGVPAAEAPVGGGTAAASPPIPGPTTGVGSPSAADATPVPTVGPAPRPPAPALPADGSPCESTLPYDVPDFTGRQAELAALEMMLPAADADPAVTIVVVEGMAGVGKTAFAVHAAQHLRTRYPDGQFLLDLHGLTAGRDPLDPAEALDRLLRWIGVPGAQIPTDPDERAGLWRDRTAHRRILLVLDNAIDSPQVQPLIPGSGGSLVLATSRTPLSGIDGAVPLELRPPSPQDGHAFLSATLGEQRVAAEPEMVGELLDCCGHLPLAVRIAAVRLQARPHWQLSTLVQRLRRAERPGTELTVGGRGVEAAIRLSYDSVSAGHQRLFRLLCRVALDSVTPYLAGALMQLSSMDAEAMLEDLLDARLLDAVRPNHYQLHDLVRSFGSGLPGTATGDIDAELIRWHDALLAAVRAAASALQPDRDAIEIDLQAPSDVPEFADDADAYAWLDDEYPTIKASAQAAPGLGLHRHAVHYARELTYYLQVRGDVTTQISLLRQAVASATELGDREAELRSLMNLFAPLWYSGDVDGARGTAERALALARSIGSRRAEGVCIGNVGVVLKGGGRFRQALDYFRQALQIHTEVDNARQQTATDIQISLLLADLGELDEARATAESVLQRVNERAGAGRRIIPTINLAYIEGRSGDAERAQERFARALELAEQVRMPLGIALAENGLADLAARTGAAEPLPLSVPTGPAGGGAQEAAELLGSARTRASRAAEIAGRVGDPGLIAQVSNTLGLIDWRRGDPVAAAEAYQRAAECARRARDPMEQLTAAIGVAVATEPCDGRSDERWSRADELATAMDPDLGELVTRCRRSVAARVPAPRPPRTAPRSEARVRR